MMEFKIGDILECSWGYDQTNIDYYQIVNLKGIWAYVRKLKKETTETGFMSGHCIPKDEFASDKIKRRKINYYKEEPFISLSKFESASLWNGKESYCSWYA